MPLTYALFETAADVCAAVTALDKKGFEHSSLSFIGRDLEADTGEQDDRRTTIAQVARALDLEPVALHLDPLALVVVPEGGTFLTAGWPAQHLSSDNGEPCGNRLGIYDLLGALGHTNDEAEFLGSRLQAGALFLGVSNPDEGILAPAREIFADQQAVYVGLINSESSGRGWSDIALPRLDSDAVGGTVVVDVATTTLDTEDRNASSALRGATLVDESHNEVGTITATILDHDKESNSQPAYIIVEHGGFLGVGQRLHALPFELVDHQEPGSYRVRCSVDVIENAPAFDADLPFSRREEQIVCAYYGTKPYWEA